MTIHYLIGSLIFIICLIVIYNTYVILIKHQEPIIVKFFRHLFFRFVPSRNRRIKEILNSIGGNILGGAILIVLADLDGNIFFLTIAMLCGILLLIISS